MTDDAVATTEPPATPRTPVWEDFIDIFHSPSEVFARRRGASPWPVFAALTVILALLFFAWQQTLGPVLDLEMERAMGAATGEGAQPGPEQLETMRSMGRIFALIGFVVGFPVGMLLAALVAWGLTRAFGAAAGFATILLVVAYSQIVRIVQYAAGVFQGLFMDVGRMDSVHDVGFSLARFMDPAEASAMAVNLAARVDLFTLWATALIAIGLGILTSLPRGRAWAVALLVWALAGVPALLGGLASG